MNKDEIKKIEELMKEIKSNWGYWENVHGYYDDIVYLIAKKHEPKLMKKIDKLIETATFWYA